MDIAAAVSSGWIQVSNKFFSRENNEAIMGLIDKYFHLLLTNWPQVEEKLLKYTWHIIDIFFSPKQILRQLGLVFAIQSALLIGSGFEHLFSYLYQTFTENGKKVKEIHLQMEQARSYDEWKLLAEAEDRIHGYDKWRESDESTMYDCRVLNKRISDLNLMIEQNRIFDIMFRLRGGLARDQYGMQHEGLYTRARGGTKKIVEKYHETVASALNLVCDGMASAGEEPIPIDAKLAFFNEARHAYGRTALLLSGGAALGFYHVGLAKALWYEGMLPRVISGASAGSIIAGVLGTRTDNEILDVLEHANIRMDFFKWANVPEDGNHKIKLRPNSFLNAQLQYLLPNSLRWVGDMFLASLFDREAMLRESTEHLKECIIANVGHYTFQEAFDRTGRIINITVAPSNNYDPPRLLNYLTAPHVCVWSAAMASCAIPGVFESIQLYVKEPNGEYRPEHMWTLQGSGCGSKSKKGSKDVRPMSELVQEPNIENAVYTDGSIENDLPMQQISELFNVNHFIVSQVNPHSSILSSLAVRATVWSSSFLGASVSYLRFLKAQLRDWLNNVIELVVSRSLNPSWNARRGVVQLMTQEYEGRPIDVTIQPWGGYLNPISALFHVIENIGTSQFKTIVKVGESKTWPYLARIKAQCLVERALDICVNRLRQRMIHQAGSEPFTTNEMSNEDVVHVRKGQSSHFGKMGGRVPSFYSTPSNSKLNELSVSDPYHIDMRGPAVQQGTNSGDSYSMSLNDVHHSITASIASDSTLSDNGFDEASVDRTMHVRCDSDLSLYSTTGVRPQSYYVYKENDSDAEEHTSSSDGSFRALASRRKGSRDAHAKPFIEFGNSSDDLTRVDSLNIPPCLSRSSSRHSIRGLSRANSMAGVEESDEHEGMARTPSMADFYYRRGHSNDRLETLGEYQGKDQEDTE